MSFFHSRVFISLLNLIGALLTVIVSYLIFVAGAFASDSGTTAAMTVSLSLMALAFVYPFLILYVIYRSQKRRSLKAALIPFILPAFFFVFIFSPWFSFS